MTDQTAQAPEENLLIKQAQTGDRWAFGELVRRHRAGVVNVVYRMCGDAALAEDAAQECFIRAWQHLHTYRPQSPFRNWLYRIATNCAINELRRVKPVVDIDDLYLPDDRRGPEAGAEQRERAAAVQAAILALPAAGRSALILREYEGLSYRDIAETLDIPIGTVMSRLNYARRLLRDALAGYMEVAS